MTKVPSVMIATMFCLATPHVARAQSTCDQFVADLSGKNDGFTRSFEAIKKLQPRPQHCAEARKLAQLTFDLDAQIKKNSNVCSTVSPTAFVHMRLKNAIAVSEFHATIIEDEVNRLCR